MADSSTLIDRVKIFAESSGSGPFVLGNAVPAFRGAEVLTDGLTYSYAVENGADYEAGQCVYVAGANQLLRTPSISSAGGAPVPFPANVAIIFTALAADLTSSLEGTGTVRSVSADGGTTGLGFTGSPIQVEGTLVLGGVLNVTNGGTGGSTGAEARAGLGLGNVDNTSDANKPVSTATQVALDTKVATADLAAAGGSSLVGYQRAGAGTILSSAANQFSQRLSIDDFVGADRTGTTSSTAAAAAAAAVLTDQLGGLSHFQAGTYLCAITIGNSQNWRGEGPTSEISIPAPSTIKKNTNGATVTIDGYAASLSEIGIDGNSANFSGVGVHIKKARFRASGVSINDTESHAFHLDPGAGINGNAWRLSSIYSNSVLGSGMYIDHTGNTPTGSFPFGPPDINAGFSDHAVILSSTEYGVYGGNSIDNVFMAPVIQSCGREGIFLDVGAQGYKIFAPYLEANGSDASGNELIIKAGSTQHIVIGNRYCLPGAGSKYLDENAPGKNYIVTYEDGIGRFAHWGEISVLNPDFTATGEVHYRAFLGANADNVFNMVGTIPAGNGGAWGVETKRLGDTAIRRLSIDHLGNGYVQNATAWTFGKAAADTTTPGLTVYANGSPRLDFVGSGSDPTTLTAHYNANGFVGGISMSGSATTYGTSSDRRLKKKIQPLEGGLELVVKLRPVTFEFRKDKSGDRHQGFIADEVQKLLPLAVIGDPDGEIQLGRIVFNDTNGSGEAIEAAGTIVMEDVPEPVRLPDDTHFEPTRMGKWYQSLDLAKIVPALTGAVQELARRDEAKDVVIAELMRRLSALEKRG
jgi:hypothetical protein